MELTDECRPSQLREDKLRGAPVVMVVVDHAGTAREAEAEEAEYDLLAYVLLVVGLKGG